MTRRCAHPCTSAIAPHPSQTALPMQHCTLYQSFRLDTHTKHMFLYFSQLFFCSASAPARGFNLRTR